MKLPAVSPYMAHALGILLIYGLFLGLIFAAFRVKANPTAFMAIDDPQQNGESSNASLSPLPSYEAIERDAYAQPSPSPASANTPPNTQLAAQLLPASLPLPDFSMGGEAAEGMMEHQQWMVGEEDDQEDGRAGAGGSGHGTHLAPHWDDLASGRPLVQRRGTSAAFGSPSSMPPLASSFAMRPKPREIVARRQALDQLAATQRQGLQQDREEYLESLRRAEIVARERMLKQQRASVADNFVVDSSPPPVVSVTIRDDAVFGADASFSASPANTPAAHIPSPEERIMAMQRSGASLSR